MQKILLFKLWKMSVAFLVSLSQEVGDPMSKDQPMLIPLPKFKLLPIPPESKFQGSHDVVVLNNFDQFDEKELILISRISQDKFYKNIASLHQCGEHCTLFHYWRE